MKSRSRNSASVFISAGEASGDMHASLLMAELKQQSPGTKISFSGLGGDLMKAEGLNPFYHIKDLTTIGFKDVIKKYSFFKKALKDTANIITENKPDTVILVDYPGFNLRLAEAIRPFYKNKIIYYISPQLWAWHEKRVHKVKKYVDLMMVVFPFEVDFYKKYGIKAEFTGHPLVGRIQEYLNNNPLTKAESGRKVITVLPGSRKDEVRNHLPVILESLNLISEKTEIDVYISCAQGNEKIFENYKIETEKYTISKENPYGLIRKSDLVLTKAGTSSMECTLLGVPYLLFYKTFPLNYYLLKPVVKVNRLGIANLLLGKDAVKEFIQNDFTPGNIAGESLKILNDEGYRKQIVNDLKEIWNILGSKDASKNAAMQVKETAGI